MPELAISRRTGAPSPMAPTGEMAYLPWEVLHESPLNPRRHWNAEEERELAESIYEHGLLQNLVVRSLAGRGRRRGAYEIVAGNRRYRAVGRLIEAGRFAPDNLLPCRIVELSDRDVVLLALGENLQRADLTPLEEGDAYARLVNDPRPEFRADFETIAAKLCRPLSRIKRRFYLAERLAPEGRDALNVGLVTLGQAEALCVGEKSAQTNVLPAIKAAPGSHSPADIRNLLMGANAIPLRWALFDRALYRGKSKPDLFEEAGWALDPDEFRRLQLAACEGKKAELDRTWSWVEIQQGGFFNAWAYDKDRPPATGGAVIHLRRDLQVEIHTGLGRRTPAPPPAKTGPAPWSEQTHVPRSIRGEAPPWGDGEPVPPFSREHLVWARHEKSRRLQNAVAQYPAAAEALAILGLRGCDEVKISADRSFALEDEIANPELDGRIERLLAPIANRAGAAERFQLLMAMETNPRRELLAALVAEHFASWPGYDPDLGDSDLVLAVAGELDPDLEPREPFPLTVQYLERLSRGQLLRVARQCGALTDGQAPPMVPYGGTGNDGALVDQILLEPGRDPAWYPPELRFATKADILAELAPPAAGDRPEAAE